MIRFEYDSALEHLSSRRLEDIRSEVLSAHRTLVDGSGPGCDYLGWRSMLGDPNDALLEDIQATAARIRDEADVLLCIGIGGSYLGAKAVIDALSTHYERGRPEVLFAGHHMSGSYLKDLLVHLDERSVFVNVISKSGTTLEPALAFRFIRRWMEERFDDVNRRIIVTTDPEEGALNTLRDEKGYKKYEIPPDVGGRFSVLTPVGLLPIAAAGIDIRSLFYGAVSSFERLSRTDDNPALDYAALRYLFHEEGRSVEVLAVLEPRLFSFGGWWQQLFGESEGKDGKGLFPTVAQYSTDLHSLGQFMQQGRRNMIETFIMVDEDDGNLLVPGSQDNLDGLDYLTGRTMTEINRMAYEGTASAHSAGGVPVSTIWLDRIGPEAVGSAIYFFEHAVGVGGYLLDVNPFDQPGVEDYKQEMFRLLGRP